MSAVYEAIARRLGITLLPVSLSIFKLSEDCVDGPPLCVQF